MERVDAGGTGQRCLRPNQQACPPVVRVDNGCLAELAIETQRSGDVRLTLELKRACGDAAPVELVGQIVGRADDIDARTESGHARHQIEKVSDGSAPRQAADVQNVHAPIAARGLQTVAATDSPTTAQP